MSSTLRFGSGVATHPFWTPLGGVAAILLATAAIAANGCDRLRPSAVPAGPPVALPDLSAAAPAVRARLTELHAGATERPRDAAAWGTYGAALQAHGFDGLARAAYDRALAIEPEDFRLNYLAGLAAAETDRKAAEEYWKRAAARDPEYVPLRLRRADAAMQDGHVGVAAGEFAALTAAEPMNAFAWRGLGEARLQQGQAGEARAAFDRARELGLTDRRLWAGLAKAYQELGEIEVARSAAEKAKEAPAQFKYADRIRDEMLNGAMNIAALLDRSEAARARGDLAEARQALEEAEILAPDDPYLAAALARVLAQQGLLEQALASAQRAARVNATIPELHNLTARIYAAMKRWDDAGAEIAAGLVVRPDDADLITMRAELALQRGELAAALPDLRRAAELQPQNPALPIRTAQLLNSLGDAPAAVAALEAALRRRPDDPALATALAWHLATNPDDRVRNGARAVELLKPLASNPQGAPLDALEALAAAIAETGEYEQAAQLAGALVEKMTAANVSAALIARVRTAHERYQAKRPYRDLPPQ